MLTLLAGACLAGLGASMVAHTLLPDGGRSTPATQGVSHDAGEWLPQSALPAAIRAGVGPQWSADALALDSALQPAAVADRRSGFVRGFVQRLRDGDRQLRVTAKIYATDRGAGDAYARAARFLTVPLSDPSLRTATAHPQLGQMSLLATYDSVGSRSRYTVSALVFRQGRLLGQIQAFPAGVANGIPARDPRDLVALGTLLAAHAHGVPVMRSSL